MSEFVKNLKRLRRLNNISQNQLSIIIGANKTSIVNVENKGADPSVDLLLKLSEFFNVSIDEMLGNGKFADKNYHMDTPPNDVEIETPEHENVTYHITINIEKAR